MEENIWTGKIFFLLEKYFENENILQHQSGYSIKLSASGLSLGVEENIWRRKISFLLGSKTERKEGENILKMKIFCNISLVTG